MLTTVAVLLLNLLTLQVYLIQSFAPATLRITVKVEPQADNRMVRIIIDDGENYFRSTDLPLNGDKAVKTQQLFFPHIPPGDYDITATLYDNHNEIVKLERGIAHVIGDQ